MSLVRRASTLSCSNLIYPIDEAPDWQQSRPLPYKSGLSGHDCKRLKRMWPIDCTPLGCYLGILWLSWLVKVSDKKERKVVFKYRLTVKEAC